jgi:hypothetical protein
VGAITPANFQAANGKYSSVAVPDANGVVTATFYPAASGVNAGIAGNTITITPTLNGGSVTWTCTSNMASKYWPKACS